jgi:hypothetical protein
VLDAERPAGNGVDGRDVGGAVVGEDPLDRDPVAGEEADRSAQEDEGGRRPLVAQDLGVGEAGGVVDADVDELPAGGSAASARSVGEPRGVVLVCREPVPGAAGDPAEPLDVDVDELAGARALIAPRRLEAQPPQATEARGG